MKSTARKGRGMKRAAIVAAVVVALTVVLVAPALAAPAATTWQVSPTSKTVTYRGGLILNGTLTSADVGVGGKWVSLEQSSSASGPWQRLFELTTSQAAYSTGVYSGPVLPLQNTYYRFVWEGDAGFAGSTSGNITISVRPVIGRSYCRARVRRGHTLNVRGIIRPGAPTGPAVKVRAYRHRGHSWVVYKTYSATVTGTHFSAKIKISKPGRYRFRGFTAATAAFVAAKGRSGGAVVVRP